MLPKTSSIKVCHLLKKSKNIKNIPIIMLSARSEDVDSMQGLETGADDYVTEPYSVIVLVVRIKSQL